MSIYKGFTMVLFIVASGFYYDAPPFQEYKPVFMLRSEMEKSVRLESPRNIVNPGKIYLKDGYILIGEKFRGVHVIDNTHPEAPENIAFVHIDGCIDMAMKDNVLYADNAVDLIAVSLKPDISGLDVTCRIRNVFPEPAAPDGRSLTFSEEKAKPEHSILVRWEKR